MRQRIVADLSVRLTRAAGSWIAALRRMVVVLFFGFALFPALAHGVANPIEGKNILVLFSYGEDVQAYNNIAAALKDKLLAAGVSNDQIYFERLDLVRFKTEHKKELVALLRKKYTQKSISAIVTVHRAALDFVLDDLHDLFPTVPVVGMLLRPDADRIESPRLLRLPYKVDYRGTLELGLRLFPQTRRVVLLTGDSPADRTLEKEAFIAFAPWREQLQFESTSHLSVPEMLDKLAALPPHSLVIASTVFADKSGAAYSPLEVTRDASARANAPVFGLWDTNMAVGVVGGKIINFTNEGQRAGELALQVATGHLKPGQLPVFTTQTFSIVDWRQVERWHVDPARLPADARIVHRSPSLLETHLLTVVVAATAILLLFGMVVALAVENGRRQRAQQEARRNEERFRLLVQNSQLPMLVTSPPPEIKIVLMNHQFTEMFGYTINEVSDIQSWWPLAYPDPDYRAEIQAQWAAAVDEMQRAGSDHIKPVQARLRCRDGSERFVEIGMSLASSSTLVVFNDITEIEAHRHNLEGLVQERTAQLEMAIREISEARDAAEAATRAKSQFLANMSHEIRTPMNAILGMTDLTLRTELSAKQRDYLQKTKSAADSLLGIINDILDFSKIEAGKLEIEYSQFRLDDVLEKVANLVSLKAQEKGLEFLLDTAEDVPQMLLGDPLRLRQVLVNLCNNAVKFTERGEIAIVISKLFETLAGEVVLQFSVRDSGIGMSEAQITRLFEPFSQVDSSTTRKYGGTGLGLAISKQLVGLMGGEIGVESRPGAGSDFHFSVRFRLVETRRARLPETASSLRHLRVLVIDDSAHSRKILAGLLHPLVAESTLCQSGTDGLRELQQAAAAVPFDLVLTDLDMPDMDGFAVAAAIRRDPAIYGTPKIILVTAYGDEDVQQRATGEGLDAYLNKPVSASTLLDTLLNVCGDRSKPIPALLTVAGDSGECLPRIRGLRVLLVEDNDFNQQVAKELLEGVAGVRVRIAGNGREALDCLQDEEFDLVLMDIQMPEMDGYEATLHIRRERRWRGLPIIAMTAHAMRRDRDKCLQIGMNDYITKPFDPVELFAMLAKWAPVATPPASSRDVPAPPAIAAPSALDGISFELGLQRSFGKADILHRLLRMFMETRGGSLAEMQAMLDVGDEKGAAMMAHSLKAAAGTIGAESLSAAAQALEQAIDGQQREQWAYLLHDFAVELEKVIGGLRAYRSQHPEYFNE